MAREIDRLAEVLSGLKTSTDTARSGSLADEVESLRLIVMQMTTSLAVHEVQISKLREAIVLMGNRSGG